MSQSLIETAKTTVELMPSPIEPSWIIEGNPQARSCMLSCSSDGTASTIIWECSEGRFNWYYDFDETIMILEGSIVLESDTMPAKRYAAGDVILFRDGAHARWHVEGRVKKIAFCRKAQPAWLGFAIRAFSKLKRILLPPNERQPASLVGTG
ncbi:cupin domain-containing protein [Bradyrhizobium sp. NP1]|uniref:cupin domain-containing protein n=1 Tax=Bradyrhizobium sp. NP1 TaxID=3049772 RepID=UPI0025A5D7EB|nr:cupin domain-containing protein [Bradyrhizobium sp. NP1]WJR77841.1 cupin domain-containing protein [Bradyrhizobium sp. NP1]